MLLLILLLLVNVFADWNQECRELCTKFTWRDQLNSCMAKWGCSDEIQKLIDEVGDKNSELHLKLPVRPKDEREKGDWNLAAG